MPSDAVTSKQKGIWGVRALSEERDARLPIGPLELVLRRRADELWHAASTVPGADQEPEPTAWQRWAGSDVGSVRVLPTLPDRPLVVAPEVPFHLSPGMRVRIYVRIPVWVSLRFESDPETILFETPTVVLSDTWWGNFVSGEVAYWLPITARRSMADEPFEPHLAVCPLELLNVSDGPLPVERLAVRVGHLALYADGERLWTNETHVRYEDEPEGSRIDPEDGPPSDAPNANLLGPPRAPAARGLRALTFGRLKDAVGL